MAIITQQQLEELKKSKPEGISDDVLVGRLQERGHRIQGMETEVPKADVSITPESFRSSQSSNKLISGLGKAAEFVGVERLGTRVGAGLAILDPKHRENLKVAQEAGVLSPEETQTFKTGGVTGKETAGSALMTALQLMTAGQGGSVGAGVRQAAFQPLKQEGVKLFSKEGLKQAGKAVAGSAAFGGTYSGAAALAKGKENDEVIKSAYAGAIAGAALPVILQAGKSAFNIIKDIPGDFYSRVFKPTADEIRRKYSALAQNKEYYTLAEEAVQRGMKGSVDDMLLTSHKQISDLEKQVENYIKNNPDVVMEIPKKEVINTLISVRSQLRSDLLSPRANEATAIINELKAIKGNSVSADLALRTRRFMDGSLSHSAYKVDPALSGKAEAILNMANDIRNKIRGISPELGNIIKNQSFFINAARSLEKAYAQSKSTRLIGLTDYLLGGGGLASGAPGTGFGVAALSRLFQSPPYLTGIGQAAQKFVSGAGPANVSAATKSLFPFVGSKINNE